MKRKLFTLLTLLCFAVSGAWADDTYYYGSMVLTDGALTKGSTGTIQFVKAGVTLTSSTDISLTATPGEGGIYYNSNDLSSSSLSTSSNWSSSSSSDRYIRGLKFASGTTYTLKLGTKTATSITFYGWCGSKSKTLTIGGVEYGTPGTKNQFFSNEFTKSGNFTGDVSITQNGDCYGILVVVLSETVDPAITITYNLTTNSGSTTLDNCTSATPTSGDIVASTTINTFGTAGCDGTASAKTDETQKLKIDDTYTAANYYEWTFTIGSSVNFMPTQVVMKFQAVSDLTQYKVELTDGTTSHTTNFVQTTSAGGTLETLTWNINPGTAFAGGTTGRLKLWAYKKNVGATAFRLGSPITIKGVVNVPITPGHDKTTYVTTKKLDFSGVAGLKAYVATSANASGVTMTQVEVAVPENTPLLLVGTAGNTYNIPVVASASAPETNLLKKGDGTTVFNGTTYDYILYSDGKFYQIGSGTVATTKAYLHLDSAPSAHALDIIFEESGEATGITEVSSKKQFNGEYYNLAGQRIAQPTKGLYIVNGKKVIVR